MTELYPSLISGDLLHLADCIKTVEPDCDGFHLDVMDFHFVPNLTWGPCFINAIRKTTQKKIWVDLLVDTPEKYLNTLQLAPGDMVSIHFESSYPTDIWQQAHKKGLNVGVGLDPATPVSAITELIPLVDHILLMSVQPGFSGQQMLPTSAARLKELHELCDKIGKKPMLCMDGGINTQTLPPLLNVGIDAIAAASGIFSAPNQKKALQELRSLTRKGL
jgi:ribulose-phosphate 3-epimerase